jgi:Na+-translocating ferredoxin:NAD+ oxidoreductase RnfC subunit
MKKAELLDLVREGGIVGKGGAGFPTHVKLAAKNIDTYLINAAECEPLLRNNMELLRLHTDYLVKTASDVTKALGIRKAVFCIKKKHTPEIEALKEAGASVFEMKDYYPAGDEVIMIQEATGRTVPEGGLPLEVGVIVNNVETLYNIGKAMEGIPVTHSLVTVGGAVKEPGVWNVPIGTKASELLELAGGTVIDDPVFIDGGPMTGRYYTEPDFTISKTSNGLLVIPKRSPLVHYEMMPLEQMIRQARYACCQCSQCTEVCSRKLVGFKIEPHKVMRAMAFPEQRTTETLKMALLCSECNLCSGLHACPMMLSPRRVNQFIKGVLRDEGIKAEFPKRDLEAMKTREYRLLPSKRLIHRIGLAPYDVQAPYKGEVEPGILEISLKQNIGAPCLSVVSQGDVVEKGQRIGRVPDKALGAELHSPCRGTIEKVSADSIRIRALKEETK